MGRVCLQAFVRHWSGEQTFGTANGLPLYNPIELSKTVGFENYGDLPRKTLADARKRIPTDSDALRNYPWNSFASAFAQ